MRYIAGLGWHRLRLNWLLHCSIFLLFSPYSVVHQVEYSSPERAVRATAESENRTIRSHSTVTHFYGSYAALCETSSQATFPSSESSHVHRSQVIDVGMIDLPRDLDIAFVQTHFSLGVGPYRRPMGRFL